MRFSLLSIFILYGTLFSTRLRAQEKTTYGGDTTQFAKVRLQIAAATDSLEKDPVNAELYYRRGTLFFDIEQWAQAEKDLTRAIGINDKDYRFFYKRGAVRERLEKRGDAFEDFETVIALAPDFVTARLDRGIIHTGLGMHAEADADFREVLTRKPGWAAAYFNIGNNFDEWGKRDSARYYYQLALKADSTLHKAWNNLGVLNRDDKKYNEALYCFNRAMQANPNYVLAFYNRVRVRLMKGDKAGACADLDYAVRNRVPNAAEVKAEICK